jgi:hypothetical protein
VTDQIRRLPQPMNTDPFSELHGGYDCGDFLFGDGRARAPDGRPCGIEVAPALEPLAQVLLSTDPQLRGVPDLVRSRPRLLAAIRQRPLVLVERSRSPRQYELIQGVRGYLLVRHACGELEATVPALIRQECSAARLMAAIIDEYVGDPLRLLMIGDGQEGLAHTRGQARRRRRGNLVNILMAGLTQRLADGQSIQEHLGITAGDLEALGIDRRYYAGDPLLHAVAPPEGRAESQQPEAA